MRLAIVGSEHVDDRVFLFKSINNFLKEFSIENPTIILRDEGKFSKLIANYIYQRGWDIIAIPVNTIDQMNTFNSCTDRILSFVDEEDKNMMSFLKKARKSNVGVVYFGPKM